MIHRFGYARANLKARLALINTLQPASDPQKAAKARRNVLFDRGGITDLKLDEAFQDYGPEAAEGAKNKALPIGGGLWIPVLHPGAAHRPAHTQWTFLATPVRMPEFCAPALGNKPNLVTIDAFIPPDANGVLYKLGANSGGLTCYVEDGILCYEYNLFIIQRTKIRAAEALPTGNTRIEIETRYVEPRPGGPLKVTMRAGGKVVAEGVVPISAPLIFTANDCLDIGVALGSPVSLDYYDKAPFRFNGTIEQVHVRYLTAG